MFLGHLLFPQGLREKKSRGTKSKEVCLGNKITGRKLTQLAEGRAALSPTEETQGTSCLCSEQDWPGNKPQARQSALTTCQVAHRGANVYF